MASSLSAVERPVCAICLDEILPDAIISKLNCGHEYHQDCLQPWLDKNHTTCPLDRDRITSINGVALEHPEEKEHIHEIVVENPLEEARALYEKSRGIIVNPSIHSADPIEQTAARVMSIFNSIFRRLDYLDS